MSHGDLALEPATSKPASLDLEQSAIIPSENLPMQACSTPPKDQITPPFEGVDASPTVTTLLLSKQGELGSIIRDIQIQVHCPSRKSSCGPGYWREALYHKLNASLWRWYDSLPGEMRWNRWSSNLEDVDPGLANLQYVFLCLLATYLL